MTEISKSKNCKVKQIELNLKPGFMQQLTVITWTIQQRE